MMEFVPTMMEFVLKMMEFVPNMMDSRRPWDREAMKAFISSMQACFERNVY